MFTIGPFGRLGGTSSKVLRTYDRLGLFRPVWLDPASGYRYYSPAQLPELRRILALRELGIGLADIGRLVAGEADLRESLERRRSELERDRREIERRLAALDIRVDEARPGQEPLDVVVRPLRSELVATMRVEGDNIGAAFFELEAHVRDSGRRASRPPGAIDADAGGLEVFVPLSGPVPTTERISQRRLPAGRAATVIVRGPYERVGEARTALESWVAAAGLERAGELRILYLQFGAETELRLPRGFVVDRAADYVTELQLPVA